MTNKIKKFLLVEPIAKTPYPPLGLMKIGTYLRKRRGPCKVFATVGNDIPSKLSKPQDIYITSLFTWDLDKVIKCVQFYSDHFPRAKIFIGGIAASLLPDYVEKTTGIRPHVGLFEKAEKYSPDYSLSFGRKIVFLNFRLSWLPT